MANTVIMFRPPGLIVIGHFFGSRCLCLDSLDYDDLYSRSALTEKGDCEERDFPALI